MDCQSAVRLRRTMCLGVKDVSGLASTIAGGRVMTRKHVQTSGVDEVVPPEEIRPFSRVPWLTHRRILFFVIGWLVAFSLGSIFVSNPFQSEPSASAALATWHVMYLHGLLIGVAGLLALLVCGVLCLRSTHTRVWIAGGVIVATLAAGIGGVFDRRIPGTEVAMWTQIIGFFALDEILIVLLVGMWSEWRLRSALSRTLPFLAAALGVASMLVAAVMGHLAGWILEFGDRPGIIGSYARARGLKLDDFTANLTGSHSHDMVVAVMAVAAGLAVQQFGYSALSGGPKALARMGLSLVAVGVVVMTVMYVRMGFTAWSPPTLFQSAGGTNGVAGDDIVTGVFVMFGGLLALAGAMVRNVRRPVRLAAAWSWLMSFAVVVVTGYWIELHETYFGAGDKAPGAAHDAVFTWAHQDIGLFLLPTVVLLMLVVDRFLAGRQVQKAIGWAAVAGSTVLFLGVLVYTFADAAVHGPAYGLSTLGLLLVGAAVLGTVWWGTAGRPPQGGPAGQTPEAPRQPRLFRRRPAHL